MNRGFGRGTDHPHVPPSDCPVCGTGLEVTRLGCASCGTELVGRFEHCEFCALGAEDRQALKVFLAARGNIRELGEHLQVSYPTARQRLGAVLDKLGLIEPPEPKGEPASPGRTRDEVLAEVAAGRLSPREAQRWLTG